MMRIDRLGHAMDFKRKLHSIQPIGHNIATLTHGFRLSTCSKERTRCQISQYVEVWNCTFAESHQHFHIKIWKRNKTLQFRINVKKAGAHLKTNNIQDGIPASWTMDMVPTSPIVAWSTILGDLPISTILPRILRRCRSSLGDCGNDLKFRNNISTIHFSAPYSNLSLKISRFRSFQELNEVIH